MSLGKDYVPLPGLKEDARLFEENELKKHGYSLKDLFDSDYFSVWIKTNDHTKRVGDEISKMYGDSSNSASDPSGESKGTDKGNNPMKGDSKQDLILEQELINDEGLRDSKAGKEMGSKWTDEHKKDSDKDKKSFAAVKNSDSDAQRVKIPEGNFAGDVLNVPTDDLVIEDIKDENVVDELPTKIPDINGSNFKLVYDISASGKLNFSDFNGLLRVNNYVEDDLILGGKGVLFKDPSKFEECVVNEFVSNYVFPAVNIKRPDTEFIGVDDVFGSNSNYSKTPVVSPNADCINLSSLCEGTVTSLAKAYSIIQSSTNEACYLNGLNSRTDPDTLSFVHKIPLDSYKLVDGKTVPYDMDYSQMFPIVTSDSRIFRMRKMVQFSDFLRISRGDYIHAYGKFGTGPLDFERVNYATSTEEDVNIEGVPRMFFPLEQSLNYCLMKGFGDDNASIPDYDYNMNMIDDYELGKDMREQSRALADSSIFAYPNSLLEPKGASITSTRQNDVTNAMGNLDAAKASRFLTDYTRSLAGNAYGDFSIDAAADPSMEDPRYDTVIPFAACASLIMVPFTMFDNESKRYLITKVLTPWFIPTAKILDYFSPDHIVDRGDSDAFVNDCFDILDNTSNYNIGSYNSGNLLNVRNATGRRLVRGWFKDLYNFIIKVTNMDLNSVNGRFHTYQTSRNPRGENGVDYDTAINERIPIVGNNIPQKGRPVNGNYYDRDMCAMTFWNMHPYQDSMIKVGFMSPTLLGQQSKEVWDIYSVMFMGYLKMVHLVNPKIYTYPRDSLASVTSSNYVGKGGGLMKASVDIMYAEAQDCIYPMGPKYHGAPNQYYNSYIGHRAHVSSLGQVNGSYNTCQLDQWGALSYMFRGIGDIDWSAVSKFSLSNTIYLGNVSTKPMMNVQVVFGIANDIMTFFTNPSNFKKVKDTSAFIKTPKFGNSWNDLMFMYHMDLVHECGSAIITSLLEQPAEHIKLFKTIIDSRDAIQEPTHIWHSLRWNREETISNNFVNKWPKLSILNATDANGKRMWEFMSFNSIGDCMTTANVFPWNENRMIQFDESSQPKISQNSFYGRSVKSTNVVPRDFRLQDRYHGLFISNKQLYPSDLFGIRRWDTSVGIDGALHNNNDLLNAIKRGSLNVFDLLKYYDVDNLDANWDQNLLLNYIKKEGYASGIQVSIEKFQSQGLGYLGLNANAASVTSDTLSYSRDYKSIPNLAPTDDFVWRVIVNGENPGNLSCIPSLNSNGNANNRFSTTISHSINITSAIREVLKLNLNQLYVSPIGMYVRETLKMWDNNQVDFYAYIHDPSNNVLRDIFTLHINYLFKDPLYVKYVSSALFDILGQKTIDLQYIKAWVNVDYNQLNSDSLSSLVNIPSPTIKYVEKNIVSDYVSKSKSSNSYDPNLVSFSDSLGGLSKCFKIITDASVTVPITNTQYDRPVAVDAHAFVKVPVFDEEGFTIPPFSISRRHNGQCAVIGAPVDTLDLSHEGLLISKDVTASQLTQVRAGQDTLLYPMPQGYSYANKEGALPVSMPPFKSTDTTKPINVRSVSFYDFNNNFEFLYRLRAIPFAVPKKVNIIPFKFTVPKSMAKNPGF